MIKFLQTEKVGKKARDGILEVEYGYYPQKAASKEMQYVLEKEFEKGRLSKTGNTYTTDSGIYKNSFLPIQHQEYNYNGKRYVRVDINFNPNNKDISLSNGEQYKKGDSVWVEVQPIKWLVDEKDNVMVTEKIIFAGIPLDFKGHYPNGDIRTSDVKKFMDEYWAKDILQGRKLSKKQNVTEKDKTSKEQSNTSSYKNEEPKVNGGQNCSKKRTRNDEDDKIWMQ